MVRRALFVLILLLCYGIAFGGAEAAGPLDDDDPPIYALTTAQVPPSQSTAYEFLGSGFSENVLDGSVTVTGVKRYGYETIIVAIADASTNVLLSGVTSVTWGATALSEIQSGAFQGSVHPPYSQVSIYQLESSPGNPNAQSAAQSITVTWGGAVKPVNKAVMVVGIRNTDVPSFDFCDSPVARSATLVSGTTSSSTAVNNEMALGVLFRLGPSSDEDVNDWGVFTAGNRVGTNSGLTSGGLSLDVNIDTAWWVDDAGSGSPINFSWSWGTTVRDCVSDIAAFKPYP